MNRLTTLVVSMLAGCVISVSSWATVMETFTFTNVIPAQTATPASGTLVSATASGTPYTLGRIDVMGEIVEINGTTNDFISDNKVQLTMPGGQTQIQTLSSVTSYTGATMFTSSFFFPLPLITSPFGGSGMIDFRFYNTFDDSPTGGVADANINTISFKFTDELPTPPTAFDFGTLTDLSTTYGTPDYMDMSGPLGGGVRWYKFTLANPINNGAGTFLDIDTETSTLSDTEIGLYDALGTLLTSDDDDGSGNLSQLTYGLTSPTRTIGTSVGGNGRDGSLAAGTYYVAAGGFNTTFSNGFTATTTSTNTTDKIVVNLRTNVVPEPTGLAFLALGATGLLLVRRK